MGGEQGVVVSIAPDLSQPRPNRLGQARGLHIYDVHPNRLSVDTYVWREDDWGLTAERMFHAKP